MASEPSAFRFLYPLEATIVEKIETIAREVYGAERVVLESGAKKRLKRFEDNGFGGLAVCVAKTQYSLSDDPKLLGRPKGFPLTVTDLLVSAGAGFIVALCGDVMTMPGMPKSPAAERIDVTEDGEIIGILG
jgi:formate--tetrahydrofolate ligase